MLEWHVVTSATYYAAEASALNDDYLYFLSDTGEIMKGAKPYNPAMEFLAAPDYALPAAPARKRIYVNPVTLEGKVYDGTNWSTIIKPVASTVTETGTDPVSGKAVWDYVTAQIEELASSEDVVASMAWTKGAAKLTYTMADGTTTHELTLEGLATTLDYDATTGALNLKDISGNVVGTGINLDLERFIQSSTYDSHDKKIILGFNDGDVILPCDPDYVYPTNMPAVTEGAYVLVGGVWYKATASDWETAGAAPDGILQIDVGDLVDTYTAEDSTSISLTVTGNKFKAEAIVSSTDGNILEIDEHGLYVAATDLSSCMQLVEGAVNGNVAKFGDDGQVVDAGVIIGGATLAETPNVTTLATEVAVQAAIAALKTTLETEINKKMDLIEGAVDGDVLTVNGDGQAVDSGKSIGGATLAETPDADTLATEAAVKAYADTKVAKASIDTVVEAKADDTTVPSTKAVAAALTWKTTL